MDALQPWFWEVWQMPPEQVERLTPRQADRFIERGLTKQAALSRG
jgi:hypothetical protein